MTETSSPAEEFWAGPFGDDYTERNRGPALMAGNLALFSRVLSRTNGVRSVLEMGANRGMNLLALKQLLPEATFEAVEINGRAVAELRKLGWASVAQGSLLDFSTVAPKDLVLVKGVLIHLHPETLPTAYRRVYEASARYVCLVEYFDPTPVEIPYRGHRERLWKRDFAGEMMRAHADLKLVDYGFVYHGDPAFPLDDVTWFLMEKPGRSA